MLPLKPTLRDVTLGTPRMLSDLFANGEKGLWYDFADLSMLYQDSAGTTPVTAPGDPVGLVLDKSGNGVNQVQSTATKRPIYGDTFGKGSVLFDGVDDSMGSSAPVDISATDKLSIFAVFASIVDTGARFLFEHSGNSENAGRFALRSTNNNARSQLRYAGANGQVRAIERTYASVGAFPRAALMAAAVDLAAPLAVYGTSGAPNSTNTLATGGGNFTSQPFFIGARSNSAAFSSGYLAELLIIDRLVTPMEYDLITRSLAFKHGVPGIAT